MPQQRWLRIIPVALIMYTISYVDRTNIALALDPKISSMMRDLAMDDAMKSTAAGIFFWGYLALQIPAGHLANHWSAKKVIAILLVLWGVCAAGCGLVKTYRNWSSCGCCSGWRKAGFIRQRWCFWPTGFRARNGLEPMPTGILFNRWRWPVPRR